MPTIRQGTIVWVPVADRNGFNFYERPVIIITRDDEIDAEDELVGVVASHTAAQQNPRPESYVEIPHGHQAHTKLKKPTVAVCTWSICVRKDEISDEQIKGYVSKKKLETVIEQYIRHHDG